MGGYPEKMEANPEEMKSLAVHEEVPNEEAAVETFGALKEQCEDWHLDMGCCRQLKKWTQGNDESQKKLTTACRGMTHHAILA
jgi:hypothetical protein